MLCAGFIFIAHDQEGLSSDVLNLLFASCSLKETWGCCFWVWKYVIIQIIREPKATLVIYDILKSQFWHKKTKCPPLASCCNRCHVKEKTTLSVLAVWLKCLESQRGCFEFLLFGQRLVENNSSLYPGVLNEKAFLQQGNWGEYCACRWCLGCLSRRR